MAISNNSTGLRPGVCLSTTRPTAPYEGQMIYQTDDDLTYIWGGSAWQQVSGGTAVGNSGLVYIKSQTVGTAVSTVTVTNAFSSTYDNYRIIYSGGVSSTALVLTTQLGASTTGYYGGLARADVLAAASNLGMNNTANFQYSGFGGTDAGVIEMELYGPFLASFTIAKLSWLDTRTSNAWGQGGGVHRVATSYSDFSIIPSGGTITGGTITIYGYRKA